MTQQILIASGKGGTGKTSLCAAFASLTSNTVFADCDVDASDLHLILCPKVQHEEIFYSGKEAIIHPSSCTNCRHCVQFCRFDAIRESSSNQAQVIDPVVCDGCGLCALVCPENAIQMKVKECGQWYSSETRFGVMLHAQLHPGGENSGKLVHLVRQKAILEAKEKQLPLILIDGPPGTGCPVIASISGCDAVIVVIEPSLTSQHDAMRMIMLARHFEIPSCIILNKWDIDPQLSEKMIQIANKENLTVLGQIPYDLNFTKAMMDQKTIIEFAPPSESVKQLKIIWEKIQKVLIELNNKKKKEVFV